MWDLSAMLEILPVHISLQLIRRMGRASRSREAKRTQRQQQAVAPNVTTRSASALKLTCEFEGHTERIFDAEFAPTSCEREQLASASEDGTVRIWDVDGKDRARVALHPSVPAEDGCGKPAPQPVLRVTWSTDATLLASGSADGAVRLWDCRGLGIQGAPETGLTLEENDDVKPHMGIPKRPVAERQPVEGGALGDFLGMEPEEMVEETAFVGDGEGAMRREMETGDQVFGLQFWPHRPNLLAVGTDDRIQFWDLGRGVVASEGCIVSRQEAGQAFGGPRNTDNKAFVFGLDFSPDGALLAAAGSDGGLHLLAPADGALVGVLPEGDAAVSSAEFAPTGDALVVSSTDGSCSVWDLRMGKKRIFVPNAHGGPAYQSKWVGHDTFLTTGHDGLVKLWDAHQGEMLAEIQYSSQLLCCAVSARNRNVLGVAGGGATVGMLECLQHDPKL